MRAPEPETWDDPASRLALKATGCDCRKYGLVHVHEYCKDDAAKIRPHLLPLVEAALEAVAALTMFQIETALAYKVGQIAAEPFVRAGNAAADLARALFPEEE